MTDHAVLYSMVGGMVDRWISSRPWLVVAVAVAVLSGGACLGANAAGRWIHVACFGGTVAAMHGMNVLLGTVYLQRRTVRIV